MGMKKKGRGLTGTKRLTVKVKVSRLSVNVSRTLRSLLRQGKKSLKVNVSRARLFNTIRKMWTVF